MRRVGSVFWFWLATLLSLGHVATPLLHEQAHTAGLFDSGLFAPHAHAPQAGDEDRLPSDDDDTIDHCAVCAHFAGLHLLLGDQVSPTAPAAQLGTATPPLTARSGTAQRTWLRPATRAPPSSISPNA